MGRSSEVSIKNDESLDELFRGRIRLIQKKDGYRFTEDPLILSYFCRPAPTEKIIDLGTGCGIIPVILAAIYGIQRVEGIELQPQLLDMAERNIVLNNLTDRVTVKKGDLRKFRDLWTPASFDVVISNPPYIPVNRGRVPPEKERALAKHELTCTLKDLLQASCYLLRKGGRFCIIYPAQRLTDLLCGMSEHGINPSRIRFVHGMEGSVAKRVLVEGLLGMKEAPEILSPLIMRKKEGEYTKEAEDIFFNPRLSAAG